MTPHPLPQVGMTGPVILGRSGRPTPTPHLVTVTVVTALRVES
jgi:hypothetical protein